MWSPQSIKKITFNEKKSQQGSKGRKYKLIFPEVWYKMKHRKEKKWNLGSLFLKWAILHYRYTNRNVLKREKLVMRREKGVLK